MLKKKLWVLVALCWPSFSYSDSIAPYYGYTGNAITDQSLRWSMGEVLPSPPGLDINAIIYSYVIGKEVDDHVTVNVQNENANGTGYIFRETDEWMPGSLDGTQINKVVGVGSIHRSFWGDGSIEVEGNGEVREASVVYTYKVTPCYDPQFDPNCPGYKVPVPDVPEFNYELYDALAEGDADQDQYNPDDELYEDEEKMSDEEKEKLEEEEKKDSKERLEKALAAADNSALFAQALAQAQIADAMNLATNINAYYNKSIAGGQYRETISLSDKQLPDNRRGLRNGLAQQLLHQQMIEMQYDNKND